MSNNQKDSFYGYRFNKLGNNPQKQSFETLDTFGAKKAFPHIYTHLNTHANCKYILFYCPNCGNAVYGEWKYYSYSCDKILYGGTIDDRNKCNYLLQKIVDNGNRIDSAVLQEIDLFTKSAICPCCNNLLNYSNGYFYNGLYSNSSKNFDFKDFNSKEKILKDYSRMEEKRKEIYKEQAKTDVANFIKQIDETNIISTYPNVVKIKESPETLNTYLQNILQTEANIISLSERLEALYYSYSENNESILSEKAAIQYTTDQKLKDAEEIYLSELVAYDNVPNEIAMEKVNPANYSTLFTPPTAPTKPIEPILQKPGLFNKKKVIEQNNVLIQQYNEACKEYEIALAQYLSQVDECDRKRNEAIKRAESVAKDKYERALAYALAKAKENVDAAKTYLDEVQTEKDIQNKEFENLSTPSMQFGNLISDEIRTAETILKDLVVCRRTLYGCNAIFGKYQNIVAVSTFSEYLTTGRCEALEGAAGAYNLYESEIRANTIISNLSQIAESLEEIKNTQYMIYSKLNSIDRTLSNLALSMDNAVSALKSMDNKLSRIEENAEIIAYNTQATAYYSKMNAELTNSLGYLVALN